MNSKKKICEIRCNSSGNQTPNTDLGEFNATVKKNSLQISDF